MTRHISDQGHQAETTRRAVHFMRIARTDLPSHATRTLQRRAALRDAAARMRTYLKIERS